MAEKKLAFFYTLNCTARCDHCVSLAGPKVERKMSFEEGCEVIRGAARTPSIGSVCFTGGENLIYKDEVVRLVALCTELGLESEVISNGYWARTPEIGRTYLEPLREAGLTRIVLSLDVYHLPYISAERTLAALEAIRLSGWPRKVACAVHADGTDQRIEPGLAAFLAAEGVDLDRTGPADLEPVLARYAATWHPDLRSLLTETYGLPLEACARSEDYRDLAMRADAGSHRLARHLSTRVLVTYQFVATEGRGRTLPEERTRTWPLADFEPEVCESVGRIPSINPEGEMYPCCSGWVNHRHLHMGLHERGNVPDLVDAVDRDAIARFMREQGPKLLLEHLKARGHDLPERYSHLCHMCGILTERYGREELEAHIREFYEAQPWRVLFAGGRLNLGV